MAEFKIIRETRSDLTVVEVVGDVAQGEIGKFLASLKLDDPTSKAIFDFRHANLSALEKKHIKSNVNQLKRFSRPEVRAALVFSNPVDFSIGRAITKAISKEGYLADIKGFYKFYLAKDWLLF